LGILFVAEGVFRGALLASTRLPQALIPLPRMTGAAARRTGPSADPEAIAGVGV